MPKPTLHSYLPKGMKWILHLQFQRKKKKKFTGQESIFGKTNVRFFQKYHLYMKDISLS